MSLEGIRVFDLSSLIAGPVGTSYLAMMGAEVIKCESNARWDYARKLHRVIQNESPNVSAVYAMQNVSKKCITLDLTRSGAVELAKQVIKISDVVVESSGVDAIEKLGLGWPTLQRTKSDIIMVSCSGFGATGPERNYKAYGRNLHAASGLAGLIGYPGGPPRGLSAQWTDSLTSTVLVFAVLTALHHRSLTGEGQHVDISMLEATSALLFEPILDYLIEGRVPELSGNASDYASPHGCYGCKGEDKWVAIAVSNDSEWKGLAQAIGNPDWTKEDRFSDQLSRWHNREELDRLVEQWTVNYSPNEVMHRLQKAGVPAGSVFDTEDLAKDAHLNHRGNFIEVEHPELGKRRVMRLPWSFGDPSMVESISHAPLLGEHNEYVFCELLGLSKKEFTRLVEDKIIY